MTAFETICSTAPTDTPASREILIEQQPTNEPIESATWAAIVSEPEVVTRLIGRLVRRKVGNVAAAEDLAQDTLIRAGRAANQYDETRENGASLINWLTGFAQRQDIDNYRKKQLREAKDIPLDSEIERMPAMADISDQTALRLDLTNAIKQLRPDEQKIFQLTLLGFTQAEIAAELQIPLGTVKTRTFRGHAQLRELLPGAYSRNK